MLSVVVGALDFSFFRTAIETWEFRLLANIKVLLGVFVLVGFFAVLATEFQVV